MSAQGFDVRGRMNGMQQSQQHGALPAEGPASRGELAAHAFERAALPKLPVELNLYQTTIQSFAACCLALPGLKLLSFPKLLDLHPIKAWTADILKHNQWRESLEAAVADYPLKGRIPLFENQLSPSHVFRDAWGFETETLEQKMRYPPLTCLWSVSQIDAARDRLSKMDMSSFGHKLDPLVRRYLDIPDDSQVSYCFYGSFLWRLSPRPVDLDVLVIVESPLCRKVEVGSHHLIAPDSFFADLDMPPTSREINISLVGRGAMQGINFNHDLCNMASWSNNSGLCVHGLPLVDEVSHFQLAQDVLIGCGFAFKNAQSESAAWNKHIKRLSAGWQRCAALAREYMPEMFEPWRLKSIEMQTSQESDASVFAAQASAVAEAVKNLAAKIRENAIRLIRNESLP